MLPCYVLLGIFVSLGDEHISVKGYLFLLGRETLITIDMCFLGIGEHIILGICASLLRITRDICFPGRRAHIS